MKIEINTCDCCNSVLVYENRCKGFSVSSFLRHVLHPNYSGNINEVSYNICLDCESKFIEMTNQWLSEVEDKRLNFRGHIITNIIEKFEDSK